MEKPEPKRQPDSPVGVPARLLSARFILAAQAAMQRPNGATVEELATIVGWRHEDVEGALPEYCWGWDAAGNRVLPTVDSGVMKLRSDLLPRRPDQMAKRRPAERHLDEALRAAALATANERLGHAPDEETMVRLAEEIACGEASRSCPDGAAHRHHARGARGHRRGADCLGGR